MLVPLCCVPSMALILRVEVSQWFYQSSNNEQCEVSRAHSSEEVSVMEM